MSVQAPGPEQARWRLKGHLPCGRRVGVDRPGLQPGARRRRRGATLQPRAWRRMKPGVGRPFGSLRPGEGPAGGRAVIKGPGRGAAGRPPSYARLGAMREGLGAACEAARPRLCRLLRRILRPPPAFGPRGARYPSPRPPGRVRAGRGGRAAPRRAPTRARHRPARSFCCEGWNVRCVGGR